MPRPKGAVVRASVQQTAAASSVIDLTTPHLERVILTLVGISQTAKRETVRLKAASTVLELYLQACTVAGADDGDRRVVVIQSSTLDQVESLQRSAKAIPAEARNG